MKYLRRFNESDFEDDVISHFSFLKDLGFNIFKPFAGRYVIHKLKHNGDDGYKIIHFDVSEIKDDIMPIFQLFNVEKVMISSYYFDDRTLTIDEFDELNNVEINRLFFDIG